MILTKQSHTCKQMHSLMKLVAVFLPAVLLCLRVFGGKRTLQEQQWWLAMVLLQPAAVLIDHGHFQYNNISLGFAVRATFSANCCALAFVHFLSVHAPSSRCNIFVSAVLPDGSCNAYNVSLPSAFRLLGNCLNHA